MRSFFTSAVTGLIAGALGAYLVVGSGAVQPRLAENQEVPRGVRSDSVTDSREAQIIETVKRATPAVVSIVITQDIPIIERYYEELPFNDPFGSFFGNPFSFRVPRERERGTTRQEVGGGSGFLVSSDGLIVTNRHVVDQSDADYTVFTQSGDQYEATVIARDPVNDIAVLKVDATDLAHLTFGDSDALQVGQSVIAIGNALSEFDNSVSVGVVSGLSRSILAGGSGGVEEIEEVIQTDAAINPGNSGGPLLNLRGEVVGVNVAVALGGENIGFSLPANLVSSVVSSVQSEGRIVRPYLGVRYMVVTPVMQERNNLSVDYGALVIRGEEAADLAVIPGSPADKAGLQENDIILSADGGELRDDTNLARIIRSKQVGDTMQLRVLRAGEELTLSATLEEFPQDS